MAHNEHVGNVTPVCCLVLSWFSMEQVVDLKAEGLWDELLDDFQPEIAIQDWWVNEYPPTSYQLGLHTRR